MSLRTERTAAASPDDEKRAQSAEPHSSSPTRPFGHKHEGGELHRLLVESVQDYAIFALDPHGYILSWNAGAERIKGYRADEIIGKHFSIFYPPEKVAERFPDHELEVAEREGRFEDEGWRIRKDGGRFWASVVITALRGDNRQLLGFAKVTRDLTKRRRAEEALRESEERFRLLVQGVRDYAIFLLDPDGCVATWNEGAQRFKGYTAEEIIGRHFSTFYPQADIAANKPQRELEIATRVGKYEEEGWRVRKDGSRFWANVLITALRNSEGRLIGFGKVTRDLTERVEAQRQALEDARRVATEEAARQAAEVRARELRSLADKLHEQADELELRSREAEDANRAKSQFLAAMSHELRTPLNAIGGYAELIELGISGPINEKQRGQLQRIRSSQQHLLGIINDILNFSRTEAGQLSYDLGPVRIVDIVDSVVQMIVPQAEAKNIALHLECSDDTITVYADRAKAEQVLLNLLSNAMKFTTAEGSINISCRAEGGSAWLSVRDTGRGIAREKLKAIFEPFVQVGRSLTNSHEGTGLGLAISRELARAMGGDVTVVSEFGSGSTFEVRLPLLKSEN